MHPQTHTDTKTHTHTHTHGTKTGVGGPWLFLQKKNDRFPLVTAYTTLAFQSPSNTLQRIFSKCLTFHTTVLRPSRWLLALRKCCHPKKKNRDRLQSCLLLADGWRSGYVGGSVPVRSLGTATSASARCGQWRWWLHKNTIFLTLKRNTRRKERECFQRIFFFFVFGGR